MSVGTPKQPDYNDAAQSGTAYPLAIDEALSVVKQIGDQFAPHEAAVPDMTVVLEPGRLTYGYALANKLSQTVTIVNPVANPYVARIVINEETGEASVIYGAEAATNQVTPELLRGSLPNCRFLIDIAANTTAITNEIIKDERVTVKTDYQGLVFDTSLLPFKNLTIKPNAATPATQIDITSDVIYFNQKYITNVAITIDTTTVGANGLDEGIMDAFAYYNIFIITDGLTVSAIFSRAASPVLPSGYTVSEYIGLFSTYLTTDVNNFIQQGNKVSFENAMLALVSATATTYTAFPINVIPIFAKKVTILMYLRNTSTLTDMPYVNFRSSVTPPVGLKRFGVTLATDESIIHTFSIDIYTSEVLYYRTGNYGKVDTAYITEVEL